MDQKDRDFWKNIYKNKWAASSKREADMKIWIQENTGLKAELTGLGAGTTGFISGSASENGHEKGDADLHILGTNVYVEVTGPLVLSVSTKGPLWFRPDKFENAIRNVSNGHDTFFAHHCPSGDLWRVVHIDSELIRRYCNHEFEIVHPSINGIIETYVQIPASDPCVRPLNFLKRYLQEVITPRL